MAGNIIKVSPEKLLSTAQEFSSQGSNISSLTSQMLNIVSSLSGAWEGDAATAYMNKFKTLESDIQVMNRMIQEHVNDLEQMANLYSQTEQSNADDAASLASGVIV
ncbi:WXG100 family type VII secretion target [Ruminococcus sp.]|uniref:WXG100 family type VII secretion target n=1 Tax=Ruminococcus sp. TaxID=41978 RepID=UPI00388E0A07